MTNPKIEIPAGKADRALDAGGWIVFGLLWLITTYFFFVLPDFIPMHFDAAGNVNRMGPKGELFLPTAIASVLFVAFGVMAKYPHTYNYVVRITSDNASRQYYLATRFLRILRIVILVIFIALISAIYATVTRHLQMRTEFGLIAIGVVLIPVITYFYKSSRLN